MRIRGTVSCRCQACYLGIDLAPIDIRLGATEYLKDWF